MTCVEVRGGVAATLMSPRSFRAVAHAAPRASTARVRHLPTDIPNRMIFSSLSVDGDAINCVRRSRDGADGAKGCAWLQCREARHSVRARALNDGRVVANDL